MAGAFSIHLSFVIAFGACQSSDRVRRQTADIQSSKRRVIVERSARPERLWRRHCLPSEVNGGGPANHFDSANRDIVDFFEA